METTARIPVVEIITATETACRSLGYGDAYELKAKAVSSLDNNEKVNVQNVTRKECGATEDLRKEKDIMVLPVDNRRVTVVLDI